MSVIRHEYIGMYLAVVSSRGLAKNMQVSPIVACVKENLLPIHTALDHMLRNVWQEIARLARH